MPPERIWQSWLVWRRALVASRIAPFLVQADNRNKIKPEALWEYDQAQGLSAAEFSAASAQRSAFYQHMRTLLERYDFLVLPAAQVWPFDVSERWPTEISGRKMDSYHRWMEVVIYATFAGLPCISVPTGFNKQGLPMGLQLIGRPQADLAVLQLAQSYESVAQDILQITPIQKAR
jgi:amidase